MRCTEWFDDPNGYTTGIARDLQEAVENAIYWMYGKGDTDLYEIDSCMRDIARIVRVHVPLTDPIIQKKLA